jgi:hypothetical protein
MFRKKLIHKGKLPNPNSYDLLIKENRDLVEMATERMYKME